MRCQHLTTTSERAQHNPFTCWNTSSDMCWDKTNTQPAGYPHFCCAWDSPSTPQKSPGSRLNRRQVWVFRTRTARLRLVSDRTLFTNASPTAAAVKSYLDCVSGHLCFYRICFGENTLCIPCVYLEHGFFFVNMHTQPIPPHKLVLKVWLLGQQPQQHLGAEMPIIRPQLRCAEASTLGRGLPGMMAPIPVWEPLPYQ